MSSYILAEVPDTSNPFDVVQTVDIRSAGGTTILDVESIDWLGRDLIRMDLPGLTVHLEIHEARDLAAALQSLALFLDEEAAV
ncbi:hypothetical protein [Leucobacter salsicius]|uniref:hypothetical protein n=1 Tax=Leucobacter salsicius TaxID=664638 RepID=UPI00034C0C41|nr:hypothetical protein [Leucobacter salsicius]